MRLPTALALSMIATAPALGADFPVIRGGFTPVSSPTSEEADQTQWDGFYAGGHYQYSAGRFLSPTTSPNSMMGGFYNNSGVPAGFRLTDAYNLGLGTTNRSGFGAFVGYNMVFGDAMIGLEADLTKMAIGYTSTQSLTRTNLTAPGGQVGDATLTGSTSARLDGYGTIRARAGWAAGSFMPFITGGVAIGKGSYGSTLNLQYAAADPAVPAVLPPLSGQQTQTTGKNDVYVLGGTVGAGVDMLVTANVMLRAEYQYVRFFGSSIPIDLHTVRAGVGVKF
ncbi:MAG: hypothetical protein BGP06_10020 [Rhizobiales bacterium 65-9]|nr:porin family protein [Hyphomicrobiales bacterium]OJY33227.1 MAG: hypothetical protein BGP06_10020 [Rhizobiales bacterium 65-9]